MSANLEPHGLDDGFELGVPLEGKRVEELRTCLAHWVRQARWKLLPKPKVGRTFRRHPRVAGQDLHGLGGRGQTRRRSGRCVPNPRLRSRESATSARSRCLTRARFWSIAVRICNGYVSGKEVDQEGWNAR